MRKTEKEKKARGKLSNFGDNKRWKIKLAETFVEILPDLIKVFVIMLGFSIQIKLTKASLVAAFEAFYDLRPDKLPA